jgi:hypothetical protein
VDKARNAERGVRNDRNESNATACRSALPVPHSALAVRLYRVRLRTLCKTVVFLFDENPHLRYIYASDLERLQPSATMVEEDVEPTVGPLWRITLPRAR